jgi:hypothetical protein
MQRELHRSKSPAVQKQIDKYQSMVKRSSVTKRAQDTLERQHDSKRIKREKREAFVATPGM